MSPQIHQGQFAGTRWDPSLYLKFSDHRLRPALELLDRVRIQSPHVIYDLGCGSGQVTHIISERWASATIYGLDNSKEMLAQAAANPGKIQWMAADIRTWSPDEPPDLLYSNATLHRPAARQQDREPYKHLYKIGQRQYKKLPLWSGLVEPMCANGCQMRFVLSQRQDRCSAIWRPHVCLDSSAYIQPVGNGRPHGLFCMCSGRSTGCTLSCQP